MSSKLVLAGGLQNKVKGWIGFGVLRKIVNCSNNEKCVSCFFV